VEYQTICKRTTVDFNELIGDLISDGWNVESVVIPDDRGAPLTAILSRPIKVKE
jgi:hypothetical protein